jgi:membrane protein
MDPVAHGPRQIFWKFQTDRGPHLAAMIAYFALLSFVPLSFIALAMLGFQGHARESDTLVRKLGYVFPDKSLSTIAKTVNGLESHATALGLVGLLFLVWTSLSLFSALESAFNIVYGRPNRPFLAGKVYAVALLSGLLVLLFAGLAIGSFGFGVLDRVAPGIGRNAFVAYAVPVVVSAVAVFGFLLCVYYFLTNVEHTLWDVLPGAILTTVVLEVTFQALPIYLHVARDSTPQRAFGGPVILLVWLYLMANVIVIGAEYNWWRSARAPSPAEDAPGLA